MHEPPPALPIGATGHLEAQPLTNAVGDHALLIRQGDTSRALLTGEAAAGRDRVVLVPLDDDVELRMDGDALAVWLAHGSMSGAQGTSVPGWASAIGLFLVVAIIAFAVLGSLTFFAWLLRLVG
jgi:hypothetical protein